METGTTLCFTVDKVDTEEQTKTLALNTFDQNLQDGSTAQQQGSGKKKKDDMFSRCL